MNKVMFIGRLGSDPEVRHTNDGTPVCNFNMATDDSYRDKDGKKVEQTDWHRIVCFNKLAENCSTYLKKGSLVYIEGKQKTRQWQNQQGQTCYTTEVRASVAEFLEPRNSQQSSQPQSQQQQYSQQQYSQQQYSQQQYNDDLGPAFPGMDDVPY